MCKMQLSTFHEPTVKNMYYYCNFTLSISLINHVLRKERAKHATAESWVPTHHTRIPAPFSRPLGTVAHRGRVLNSSLATGKGLPRPVFVMRAHGGTCGVGHVWRTGGREML